MGDSTKIEWCDATFNPWIGCTKVGPGCDNCYAENLMDTRFNRVQWGPGQPRQRTTDANWRKPFAWDRQAAAEGRRYRVFCASVPVRWRCDLFDVIRQTPNLDWLLLTKRIGNASSMIAEACRHANVYQYGKELWRWLHDWRYFAPSNVWLGATIVNQAEADRDIRTLLVTRARVRFLSCEPLLGHVDLSNGLNFDFQERRIDWVIVGGESGAHARPMSQAWAESLRRQCAERYIAFFMKQGSQANWPHWKAFERWPSELQVREFPNIRIAGHG